MMDLQRMPKDVTERRCWSFPLFGKVCFKNEMFNHQLPVYAIT